MYAKLPDDRLELFQWDNGVWLDVSGDVERIDFQFRNTNDIVYGVFRDDDNKVYIPDIVLQKAGILDALVMLKGDDGTVTVERMEIPVIARPIPPGYVVTHKGNVITTNELEGLIRGMDILPRSGGTMTGNLSMNGWKLSGIPDAEDIGDAVSKHYGDYAYLRRDGGEMTGRITGLLPPIAETEPVRKKELTEGMENTEKNAKAYAKEYTDATRIIVHNQAVSKTAFAADTTYADYGYRAAVAINGATATMIPEVIFPVQDEASYAPVTESYNGGIYIYADDIPSNGITIPTIILWRGDSV